MKEEKRMFTTEELEKQCEKARKAYERLNEQLQKQKQEEEEQRKAQLAAEKAVRKKEVDDAFDNYIKLSKAFEKDYGYYAFSKTYVNEFPWSMFWN